VQDAAASDATGVASATIGKYEVIYKTGSTKHIGLRRHHRRTEPQPYATWATRILVLLTYVTTDAWQSLAYSPPGIAVSPPRE